MTPAVVWGRTIWELWVRAVMGVQIPGEVVCWCPLCPSQGGTQITVTGEGSFTVPSPNPVNWNADSYLIEVPVEGGGPSTATWRPCGHSVTVEGRLDQPSDIDLSWLEIS